MYKLSITKGVSRDIISDQEYQTFDDLAVLFSKCSRLKNKLNGNGFVRGHMSGGVREDEGATSSRLLIIDGDEGKGDRGAPDPKDVHEALVNCNINHYIYTSHSHSEDRNKFRVVIDSKEYYPRHLDNQNTIILKLLKDNGLTIKYVKEMKAWSQCWFLPSSATPSIFQYYSYTKGQPIDVEESKAKDEKTEQEEPEDEYHKLLRISTEEGAVAEGLGELHANIRSGKEYHQSLRTLSYQYIVDGMSVPNTIAVLTTLMEGSKDAGSERWQARMDDMRRLVEGVKTPESEGEDIEAIPEFEVIEEEVFQIPPAGGILGQFIGECREMLRFEGGEVLAFASAMFILSSVAGRKFNVDIEDDEGYADPCALNMYITLAADTGVGKDQIKTVIEKFKRECAPLDGDPGAFFYNGTDNGLRPIFRRISGQRSIGFFGSEVGISGQSAVGDKLGMKKFWLSAYSQGHHMGNTEGIGYSDEEKEISSVKQVAVSKLGESTSTELFKFYNADESMESGLIPRETILRLNNPGIKVRRNKRKHFSEEVVEVMSTLVGHCSHDVTTDLCETYILSAEYDQDLYESMVTTQEHYRKEHISNAGTRYGIMMSRMFVKALKYTGIRAVVNNADDPNPLQIKPADWAWGKAMADYEIATLNACFAGMDAGTELETGIRDVMRYIKMVIEGNTKNKRAQMDSRYRKKGLVKFSCIQELAKNSEHIKKLNHSAYGKDITGIDRILNQLLSVGAIEVLKEDPITGRRGSKIIRITGSFNEFI